MKHKNTTISIEHGGQKCTIELNSWDTPLDDVVEAAIKCIAGVGFYEHFIEEYLREIYGGGEQCDN